MTKAIIFDLGGVIEKINPSAVVENFVKLGMPNSEKFFTLLHQSEVCSLFELGSIGKEDFIQHLKDKCDPKVSKSQIELAWCSNQLGVSRETFRVLELLKKKGVQLFLLSNTNQIHAQKIEEKFFEDFHTDFRSIFNVVYYSFEVQMRKPDLIVFQWLLKQINLLPEQCIYIDDLNANLEAPKKLGIHCIYHSTNDEIVVHLPVIEKFIKN
jgi:glucose-1-phosphatase